MADAATDGGTIVLCRRLGTRQFPIVLIMQKLQTSGTGIQQSRRLHLHRTTQDNRGSATHQESNLCPNVRTIQDVRHTLQTSNRQYIGIFRQLHLVQFVKIRPTCFKVHEK